MKIHEYQAKSVLARFGVPVPRGEVAFTPAEAVDAAKRLGGRLPWSRRKSMPAAAAKAAASRSPSRSEEVEQLAKQMIGMTLVTHQTGPEGKKVGRVLIEEGLDIDRELYLSILIDRATASPVIIASAAGGMDIEEVAAKEPEKILREHINPGTGIVPFQGRKLAFGMGLSGAAANKLVKLLDADLQGVHRNRRVDDRDQSADPHQGRRSARARRQSELRRQRPVPASGSERTARHLPKKIRSRSRPRSSR